MPLISLTTFIEAPMERVFNLSRSVDVHRHTMNQHRESIVNGIVSGLMNEKDTVTWKARHLFRWRTLTVRMERISYPDYFMDVQVRGDFKKMQHEHFFRAAENGTIMIDRFYFEAPYGLAGKWLSSLFLEKYLTSLLKSRNEGIRKIAVSNLWKQYLDK